MEEFEKLQEETNRRLQECRRIVNDANAKEADRSYCEYELELHEPSDPGDAP